MGYCGIVWLLRVFVKEEGLWVVWLMRCIGLNWLVGLSWLMLREVIFWFRICFLVFLWWVVVIDCILVLWLVIRFLIWFFVVISVCWLICCLICSVFVLWWCWICWWFCVGRIGVSCVGWFLCCFLSVWW